MSQAASWPILEVGRLLSDRRAVPLLLFQLVQPAPFLPIADEACNTRAAQVATALTPGYPTFESWIQLYLVNPRRDTRTVMRHTVTLQVNP